METHLGRWSRWCDVGGRDCALEPRTNCARPPWVPPYSKHVLWGAGERTVNGTDTSFSEEKICFGKISWDIEMILAEWNQKIAHLKAEVRSVSVEAFKMQISSSNQIFAAVIYASSSLTFSLRGGNFKALLDESTVMGHFNGCLTFTRPS